MRACATQNAYDVTQIHTNIRNIEASLKSMKYSQNVAFHAGLEDKLFFKMGLQFSLFLFLVVLLIYI